MYFAVNPWRPGTPEQMLALLAQLRQETPRAPLHPYVLIDAGFDQALLATFPWQRSVECSLYDGMRLEGLKKVAPHLLSWPEAPDRQLPWLQTLAASCAGKPMLSVLFSALPADALTRHFRPYLIAATEDSLEWPVRWADTRVLPGLLAALTPDERRHFLSPLHAWLSTDRQGEMCAWFGAGDPQPGPAALVCWPLDDARFAHLIDAAEADAVLGELADTQPDLLPWRTPAQNHACASRHLAIASRHGIEGAALRRHFVLLALASRDGAVDHPAMQALLAHTRQGADYASEIAALPPEFLQQCSWGGGA